MRQLILWLFFSVLILILPSCSSTGARTLGYQPKTLHAIGYGHLGDDANLSANQRWLMAQHAAKLDADRDLAKQLYQEALDENHSVGSQIMQDDNYRIYMDTYLREAQSVDYRTLKDSLRVAVDLNLSPRFYTCMAGDQAVINQCLREDKKLAFTRLGFKTAKTSSVNINCASSDCSDQFHVQGFSNPTNVVDSTLLDTGLPDTEWIANTGVSLFSRAFFLQVLIHGF